MKKLPEKQIYCFTCGGKLYSKFECLECHEWQCSMACLAKHWQTMDSLTGPPARGD